MAFKISAAERKRIEEIVSRFNTQDAAVKQSVEAFNTTLNEARGKVDDELAVLNDIRDELRGVIEDIHSEKEGEYDDKSDNWRDSDRGSATYDWLEALSEIKDDFDEEITIDTIDEMEFDISDLTDKLEEGIPAEPEY